MDDLISRQVAIDVEGIDEQIRCEMCRNPMHTDRGCDGNCKCDEKLYERIMQILDERIKPIPPAQPERKKGKWIERNPQNSDKCRLIECDQCGFSHIVGFNVPYEHWIENRNFCERCGADMRGEHED